MLETESLGDNQDPETAAEVELRADLVPVVGEENKYKHSRDENESHSPQTNTCFSPPVASST